MRIAATLIGAMGIGANGLIYQQKTGKKLLLYKLLSDLLWAIHYLLLGGYSGFAVACIGVVRESIFLHQRFRWARSKGWLLLFAALAVVSAALTWKTPMNLLPAIASLLSVFGFWYNRPALSKILAFPISFCMLIYDFYVFSYMGIANEVITLLSATVAVVLLLKEKQIDKKHE